MTVPVNISERYGLPLASQLERLPAEGATEAGATHKGAAPNGVSFADQVKDFVGQVDALQKQADQKTDAFANGDSNDIHGTMIAVEQAEISLRLVANVRNRVIEMYREVMRMGS